MIGNWNPVYREGMKSVVFRPLHLISWLLVVLVAIFHSQIAYCGIYRCDKEDGSVEFRDRPCQNSLEKSTFLPLSYSTTDAAIVKQEEKEVEAALKQYDKQEKTAERQKTKSEKQRLLAQQKAERRVLRCQRLDERIRTIEAKLRNGGKPKRNQRLQEELLHCQKMKKRYCSVLQ